jgi:hypothetical protein
MAMFVLLLDEDRDNFGSWFDPWPSLPFNVGNTTVR